LLLAKSYERGPSAYHASCITRRAARVWRFGVAIRASAHRFAQARNEKRLFATQRACDAGCTFFREEKRMSKLIVLYAGMIGALFIVACSEDEVSENDSTGSLEARLGVDGGADGGVDGGDGGATTSD
jgi:hypothetical protein